MPPDPAVIAALESAVAAAPGSVAVRLHLATLLDDSGRHQAALDHAVAIIAMEPDNRPALELAAQSAASCGDTSRAEAFGRLLSALAPKPASDDETAAERPPVAVPEIAVSEDAVDAFVKEVLDEAEAEIERPPITLADVGGLEQVKRRLQTSFLGPMRNPRLRRMYGKSLRGGLLLYGPPGCGKTFLARAVAGELDAKFFAVGLHDVLDMWLGKSEKNLHEIFQLARRHAPCVLFLDEVDALGLKRANLTHSAGRNVVVQLLNELDSTRNDNEGVFVLGATNQPWDLDPALRRPGRFDRMLLVLPPDQAAREKIVRLHLEHRPVEGVDVRAVAAGTEGYSGADLRLVCESAAEAALEDSIATGSARPISQDDVDNAVSEVRPSTRPWVRDSTQSRDVRQRRRHLRRARGLYGRARPLIAEHTPGAFISGGAGVPGVESRFPCCPWRSCTSGSWKWPR